MYKYIIVLISMIAFIGCGGAGAGDVVKKDKYTNKGNYALWEYLVPAKTSTNNYIKTTGDTVQKYQTKYIKKDNSIIEASTDVPNEQTIYTKNANSITVSFSKDSQPNGHYDLHTLVDIGNMVTIKTSNCILKKHYDSFAFQGQTYSDVIAIECGNTPGYYQKGIGEIGQEQSLNTTGRVVQFLSN